MATLSAIFTGETVGASIPDASGNGHTATNNGVAQLAAAGFAVDGAALQFDAATSSHFDVPAAVIPAGGDDFTIAMFIRHAPVQDEGYLFGSGGVTNWSCYIRKSTGYLNMYIGGARIRGYPPTFANSNDHLLVIQRTAGFLEFYVDDMVNRVDLGYAWDAVTPPVVPLSIGLHASYPTKNFDGVLDEVQFWAGGMSLAERQAISITPSPVPDTTPATPEATPSNPVTYRLTLTGAADSTSDLLLPCVSVQARLRSGSQSYLSAVIPYTPDLVAELANRPNGDLVFEHVAAADTMIVTTSLASVQPIEGVESSSINVSGWRQSTNSNPSSHAVQPTVKTSGSTGKRNWSAENFDPAIRPGDTINFNAESVIIDTISLQLSRGRESVQFGEA